MDSIVLGPSSAYCLCAISIAGLILAQIHLDWLNEKQVESLYGVARMMSSRGARLLVLKCSWLRGLFWVLSKMPTTGSPWIYARRRSSGSMSGSLTSKSSVGMGSLGGSGSCTSWVTFISVMVQAGCACGASLSQTSSTVVFGHF